MTTFELLITLIPIFIIVYMVNSYKQWKENLYKKYDPQTQNQNKAKDQ
jgi:hypothetical protein